MPPPFRAERTGGEGLDPAALVRHLSAEGARRLRALSPARRAEAWRRALAVLLDRRTALRRELEPSLVASSRLSRDGLQSGLRAIARGLLDPSAEELFVASSGRPDARPPALAVLSANLPGLALQVVFPALALARPLVVRSSSREPFFAPALLRALAAQEPALAHGFAALTGAHHDHLEEALLARCDPVLAYGGRAALDALAPRVRGRLVEYGPRLSCALVGRHAGAREVGRLARDVALFDQRGCLSVQVVLSLAPAARTAAALVRGLRREARRLPPGPPPLEEAAAVARGLDLDRMRGLAVLPAGAGAVVVEPAGAPLRPSPGGRVVRLHEVADLEALAALLSPWRGRLQGAALAGLADADDEARARLRALGVSRIASAGELQETDARWQNGGVDPFSVL